MNTATWIQLAIERMCEKTSSSPAFELKELFTGDEWNVLTSGEKSTLGKVFAAEVRSGNIDSIHFAPINPNGRHNKYIVY